MAVDFPLTSPPHASQHAALSELEIPNFDTRWAAWQAKGKASDRVVRRKIAIALPVLVVVVPIVLYALLGS